MKVYIMQIDGHISYILSDREDVRVEIVPLESTEYNEVVMHRWKELNDMVNDGKLVDVVALRCGDKLPD